MNVPFQMSWRIDPRAEARDAAEDDLVDASELFVCLRRFLANHQGEFTLRIDTVELKFDLEPDLSTVFEELPSILESLTRETIEPIELYFFEQGTDLAFELQRRGESITVGIRKGRSVGRRFEQIAERELSVGANEFLGEWCRFLQGVLDELAGFDADIKATENYRAYSDVVVNVPHWKLPQARRPRRRFVVGEAVTALGRAS